MENQVYHPQYGVGVIKSVNESNDTSIVKFDEGEISVPSSSLKSYICS